MKIKSKVDDTELVNIAVDTRLSFGALGLLLYLASAEDGEEFPSDDMMAEKAEIYVLLEELKKLGYVKVENNELTLVLE